MALGRGLSALIPEKEKIVEDKKVILTDSGNGSPVELDVSLIADNRFQPRQTYDEAKLDELAASIKENGLIQPILVRKTPKGYEVVAGERRLKAIRRLGMPRIPAIIRDVDDKEALVLALIENIQREELNAVEKAETYKRLIDEFGYTQEEIARSVGKDRVTVANLMRLLRLPKEVLQGLIAGKITEGHARAVLSVDNENGQLLLYGLAVQKGLSVRELEARARLSMSSEKRLARKNKDRRRDPETLKLEEELRGILGTKVEVNNTRNNKGRMIIEYYSLDDLDRILGVIRK